MQNKASKTILAAAVMIASPDEGTGRNGNRSMGTVHLPGFLPTLFQLRAASVSQRKR
jgi:hypothetical protein